ncbi:MAG: DUF2309 domain-containing protein [Xanthomonadales bacterium]|jgi:uncharacterized protein YbcC (UPF0753/DUF2309 family)|nr:DUF2309 domain-containing protein [Xanthomonadales bacterium]
MQTQLKEKSYLELCPANDARPPNVGPSRLREAIEASWTAIAPFWPLQNLVAVNPLQGLEDLPFEEALFEAAVWFQQRDLPPSMDAVNRETIKWCQAFFDEGQATITMPLRDRGLYQAWRVLAPHDRLLHGGDAARRAWLAALPPQPEAAIAESLRKLDIPPAHQTRFMMLLLTTLPGWAAHIKYRTDWSASEPVHPHPVTHADYLAVRLAITCALWPEARDLLGWHARARQTEQRAAGAHQAIAQAELVYRESLLRSLAGRASIPAQHERAPRAQLVFCIDVRSEPFRRALESCGDYETFGFAGFFGVPVRVKDTVTGESHASCPVLLEPRHLVRESPACSPAGREQVQAGHLRLDLAKRLYQSTKYTLSAPFALVEAMGPVNGAWMALRCLAPVWAERLRDRISGLVKPVAAVASDISAIPVPDRCDYAETALRTMGLTKSFARLVLLCGHGSTTRNNAYATSLDCGACGGRHGATNARVLAAILNDPWVREDLIGRGIRIPGTTQFVAAEHDTTTDEVTVHAESLTNPGLQQILAQLRDDLETARASNSQRRAAELGFRGTQSDGAKHMFRRSRDWAQVRPEWGLARNAAFIAAPRELTRELDLEGRAFLHSYDWRQDPEGTALSLILTAPMVVAQWINAQYLFSTLDNVAFGSGSKVTKNITGKVGVMQGNASDLMHGLPLQSVCSGDGDPWHQPQRLLAIVRAPRDRVRDIVQRQPILRKLLGNGWVSLACIDPVDDQAWLLARDLLSWQEALA